MPLPRPTLPEIIDRTDAEIVSRTGAGPFPRRSVLGVLSRVLAGASHEQLGYLERLALDLFPSTASLGALDQRASEHGVLRRPATFASGQVRLTGSDGSMIPSGVELQDPASGETYLVGLSGVIAAGTADLDVRAVLAGSGANVPELTALRLVNPLAGVDTDAAVIGSTGISGGTDQESDSSLRSRLASRLRDPVKGGAEADYVTWALAVAGVQDAYALPLHQGAGSVGVVITAPDSAGGPEPSAQLIADVEAYIGARRPVTAAVVVFGPTVVSVDFTLRVTPDTVAVRSAVSSSLEDLLAGVPTGGTVLLSQIREAVSASLGETDNTILTPTADIDLDVGQIARLGTVTWV